MAWVDTHQECPDCGSSDGLSTNEDGSTKCFVCDKFTPSSKRSSMSNSQPKTTPKKALYYEGELLAIPERKIKQETAHFYKVKTDNKGRLVYPLFDSHGEIVASKVRSPDKKFTITGDFKKASLFGQHQFGTGGKYITIVEGQDDAMAAYQMLGSKWPVVSVHSASTAVKDISNSLDYLETYESIIICFDADEPGKKAAQAVAEKFSPNKAKIVYLHRHKDSNDYLINGHQRHFSDEWWNHKAFTPVGVVSFADSFSSYVETASAKLYPLPSAFGKLESMLNGGLAAGEITTIGALTSVGKTTFINNLTYSFLSETDVKVGYLGLETTVGEIVKSMMALHSKGKHVETMGEQEEIFKSINWKERFYILDHLGSLDLDAMVSRMRSMIVAFELDIFILDPLQQALPDLSNDAVKDLMDKLLKLAKQTNVSLLVVSHMRKPSTNLAHDVSEYDLLGSSAINQVSFNTILLSRDKMGSSDEIKSSTKMQMVKCRRTGKTGEAGWLYYNSDTGHLEEGEDPYNLAEGFDGL